MKYSFFFKTGKLIVVLLALLLLLTSGCGNKLEGDLKNNSKEFSLIIEQLDNLDKADPETKEQKKLLLYEYHKVALKFIEHNNKFTELDKEFVEKYRKPAIEKAMKKSIEEKRPERYLKYLNDELPKGLSEEHINADSLKEKALKRLKISYERKFLDFKGFLSYTLMIYNNKTLKNQSEKEKALKTHPFEYAFVQEGDKAENLSSPNKNQSNVDSAVMNNQNRTNTLNNQTASGNVNKKAEGVITGNDVNVRTGPGVNFKSLGVFYKGDIVRIVETNRNSNNEIWHKIEYNNPKAGLIVDWVRTDFITVR